MKLGEAKVLLCGDRHAACYAELIAANNCENTLTPSGLDVSTLTVCRQVYVDANPILWGTNTWSFHMSSAWRLWLENRNAIQRRLLRKVHLCHSAILKFVPKATISAFKGLEELNIDIETWHIIVFKQRESQSWSPPSRDSVHDPVSQPPAPPCREDYRHCI